jgi:hypothetical protein
LLTFLIVLSGVSTGISAEPTCRLTISLIDLSGGDEMAGLIRIVRDGKPLVFASLQDRCVGLPGDAKNLGWP